MPRDGSGNYTLPLPPVVGHEEIEANWANTTLSDIEAAMTDSLSRNGNGGMLVPFRFSDGTIGAPGITFANEPTSGLYRAGLNDFRFTVGASDVMQLTAAGITIPAGKTLVFSPGSTINNVIIGNVTPAAGTFTTLNAASIGATTPGTGVFTALTAPSLLSAGNALTFGILGTGNGWKIDKTVGSGLDFIPLADNARDLGQPTSRVRALYSLLVDAGAGALNLNTTGAGLLQVAGAPLYKWDAAKFSPNNTQDNLLDLGNGSFRWKTGYFGTGGLISTGDISSAGHYVLTGSAGGLGGAVRYIGAGGGDHFFYNVKTGAQHMFAVNE